MEYFITHNLGSIITVMIFLIGGLASHLRMEQKLKTVERDLAEAQAAEKRLREKVAEHVVDRAVHTDHEWRNQIIQSLNRIDLNVDSLRIMVRKDSA